MMTQNQNQNPNTAGKTQTPPAMTADMLHRRIANRLNKLFAQSDTPNHCTITMKDDGTELELIVCAEDGREVKAGDDVLTYNWILAVVKSDPIAATISDTPDAVVNILAHWPEHRAKYNADVTRLQAYCDKHAALNTPRGSDEYLFFADWHRALYGRRPNGWVCGKRS